MKNNRMKNLLENVARHAVPESVNLMPRIAVRLERKSLMMKLRAKPVLSLLLVLLSLVLLTSVVYAIGKVIGYVPGVGLVDQSVPLRMLNEKVEVKKEGVTVGVYQVVANAEYTFVEYAWDGISMRRPEQLFPFCGATPYLKLPDGSTLDVWSGGSGGVGGQVGEPVRFETTIYYPPLPVDVNKVTFVLDCILAKGTGPEDWQIPFELIPAPEGFATPGVELGSDFVSSGPKFDVLPTSTPEPMLTPFQYEQSFPNTPTPVPNGSGLYLEQVIELPDSYILVGNFVDAGDMPGPMLTTGSVYDYLPRIEDADGETVTFKPRDDIKPLVDWGGVYSWAYEIPKSTKMPLTIILDSINIDATSVARFDFNAGPNPQVGQVWQLNLPIQMGKYEFMIDTAERIEDGYLFRYHSGIDVPQGTSFMLDIVGSSQERGPSAGEEDRRPTDIVKYSQNITYLVPPPTGQLTVELMFFETVPLQGPWTLTWAPTSKP
ncbi:MAG: hypothetical protein IPP66_06660 [Anaerolineales bacterium]|nr:hypothetical protein [Anaerolineales bacterium]